MILAALFLACTSGSTPDDTATHETDTDTDTDADSDTDTDSDTDSDADADTDTDTDADTDTSGLVDFACGDTLICDAGVEYCFHASGGAQTDTGTVNSTIECDALPTACQADPTCACLEANGGIPGGGQCTEDGTGGVFVTVEYP